MDLDELLARSAPPTAPRSATLQHELQRMVTGVEAAARPRWTVLRAALVGAAAAGVFSVGTVGAMASGIVSTPSWIPWATGAGSSCEMEFTASAAGPDGEPLSRTYTQAEKQAAVTEANRFLSGVDFSSINESEAIRHWKVAENAAIALEDPNERQPRLSGDDLALTAVGHEVWSRLATDLTEHGINTELVSFEQGWRCEQ